MPNFACRRGQSEQQVAEIDGYQIEQRIQYANATRTAGYTALADSLNETIERDICAAIDAGAGERIKHERRRAYQWFADKAAARQ